MNHRLGTSEAVYVGVCRIVGTPTQVSIRREVANIAEIIMTPLEERMEVRRLLNGSSKEGFGHVASDMDCMIWQTDDHVICELSQAENYNTERCSLILMVYSDGPPGYTMLQLLNHTNNFYVKQSFVRISDRLYVSSALYRESTLSSFKEDSTQHGPCASGRIVDMEYDLAYGFACKFWPYVSTSFTARCQSQKWPENQVLGDILTSGCHVVPIGFKGSSQEDLEWRISFSVAERKLVYCMNHTQFMCYGLLKLFLKEALPVKDTNGQPILCSYFMKNVLFWVIQHNAIMDWNPSSLLSGFWLCFKFLVSCVYHAYLPNFIIPENNIFITKIFGHSQHLLIEQLLQMYNLGTACLLHCQSIRQCLLVLRTIFSRQHALSTAESDIINEFGIDFELANEICLHDISGTIYSFAGCCFTMLHSSVRYLYASNLTPRQRVVVRKFISSSLRCVVFYLFNASKNLNNKRRLKIIHACLNLSKVSTKMGWISDRLYLCALLYSVGKEKDVIRHLEEFKKILIKPYIMYDVITDQQSYIQNVGGLTLDEKMSTAIARDIRLGLILIKELEVEIGTTTRTFIAIPPYVMTLMFLVFCYHDNPRKQRETLNELYMLLQYDKGRYIEEYLRDISWQILGICQQICGDHRGAVSSYINSLRQEPLNDIKDATYHRINDALRRLH